MVTEPKKTHHLRRFIIGTLLLGTTVFGGGIWYSMENDQFHDIFVDYVPGASSIINYVEEQRYRNKATKEVSLPEEPAVKVKIPKAGVEARAISALDNTSPVTSAKKESKPAAPVKEPKKEAQKSSSTPAKKEESAPKSNSGLPLIRVASDVSPEVKKSVESLNQLIVAFNQSKANDTLVAKVSKDISDLGNSISVAKGKYQKDLKDALEKQAAEFASLTEKRTRDLRGAVEEQEKKWSEEFQKEQQRIVDLYNSRLNTEVEATKKSVIALANNRILSVVAEQERELAKQIAEKVENEQNGRLSKLKDLESEVEEISKLILGSDEIISKGNNYVKYQLAVGELTSTLLNSSEPAPLAPVIEKLQKSFPEDELISKVVKSIPEQAVKYGVLSPAQLTARFKLLEPEIRKASLLPPDAGIAGHVGSWIFSNLLWKKEGNPIGDDVESIIARAETALSEGRVADAVIEVNQLKGWPKLLAQDWLNEGRQRSEVEFLVDVLATEGKLCSLSNK